MHDYYGHVLSLREVNDMLLQHFDEAILRAHYEPEIEPINERFQIRDNYIETRDAGVFRACPPALMELFVIMANRRDISGVRAATIRQVRDHLDLIDETFRNDPNVTRQFIDLLRAPYTLVSQLTRMRRYGVLGRYIPEFGRVIGQMQHDLFHIYTVDAHTMMVIRNMRRLHYRSSQEKFPVAYHCVKNLPKIELLYIAGLFHDIAKGRGGDHSTLGAHDVVAFCRRHQLDDEDTELVAWLVRVHLLMSATAQSKDINDPVVIHEFASEVRTERRLDYLYTLTVADINATNPTLWNGWRATLMRQLYMETRKALRRGLNLPVDRVAYIEQHKTEALSRLVERGISRERALALWDSPDPEFFIQHSVGQIVALTEAIERHDLSAGPLVLVRDVIGRVSEEGATEIFLYTRDQPRLFAASVIAMDQFGLSIHDARIHTSAGSLCFNSYIVLDESGHSISADTARSRHIERTLTAQLSDLNQYPELAKRRIPRRLKQFARPTQAELTNDAELPWSVLRVVASDRPGLLARLGIIFVDLGINVHNAKISTLGERVEDLFYITGRDGLPIRDAERMQSVTRTICERLDQHVNEATRRKLSSHEPVPRRLQPYPFERMNALKSGLRVRSNAPHIALSIGEPKHATAPFLIAAATDAKAVSAGLATYPATNGSDGLRAAISAWTTSRFRLRAGTLTAERHVLPVSGTREALFSFGQCVLSGRAGACAVLPNPFYQIYEGAILLRGTTPYYVDCPAGTGYLPDFDSVPSAVWDACELLFICSPGNPTGAVMPLAQLTRLIELADRHDFVIAADECYSEIYPDENNAPVGSVAGVRRHRPRRLRALRRLPQSVETLQPAGLALGLRRRRRGDSRTVFPVPDLPRLRDAGPRPARQPTRVVGRSPCRRQPRALSREVRDRDAAACGRARCHRTRGRFLLLADDADRRRTVHAAAFRRGKRDGVARAIPVSYAPRRRPGCEPDPYGDRGGTRRVHRCRGAYRALRAFIVTATATTIRQTDICRDRVSTPRCVAGLDDE